MSIPVHNSEPLKAYRAAAAELHEFSVEVERKLDEAGKTGELAEAKEALSELSFRTKEFEKLRSKLSPLDQFLAKYGVIALEEHTVLFVLPKGVSRIEVLKEAQQLSQGLHELDSERYWAKQAIWPGQLTEWESGISFTEKNKETLFLRIDGNVKDSTNMNHNEQVANGWNDVTLQDLAVAHTLFYLLTGKTIFQGYNVRAAGGALNFFSFGLALSPIHDDEISIFVSASRSLSAPNSKI